MWLSAENLVLTVSSIVAGSMEWLRVVEAFRPTSRHVAQSLLRHVLG